MRFTRAFVVTGLASLASLGSAVHGSAAQQPQQPLVIDSFFPKQLPRGQATVFSVAVPGRAMPQTIEVSPAASVTMSAVKQGGVGQGALVWWEITINVANDAVPGSRTLTVVTPMGRSNPLAITITGHAPSISALSVVSAQSNQPIVDVQFNAADQSGDLGDSPYVWFTLSCGGGVEPETGVVRGKAIGGAVRASIPNPWTQKGPNAPAAANKCELQLRVTDTAGTESNTLKTPVEFKN